MNKFTAKIVLFIDICKYFGVFFKKMIYLRQVCGMPAGNGTPQGVPPGIVSGSDRMAERSERSEPSEKKKMPSAGRFLL